MLTRPNVWWALDSFLVDPKSMQYKWNKYGAPVEIICSALYGSWASEKLGSIVKTVALDINNQNKEILGLEYGYFYFQPE